MKTSFIMPQVTLSVPNEKLPLLKDVLQSVGIEERNIQFISPKSAYKNVTGSVRESANYLFKKYLSWEYYSNELEFE